jgi:hypothetical protein
MDNDVLLKKEPVLYNEDSQDRLLAWRPPRWWLPNGTDLEDVIRFLPCTEGPTFYDEGREYWKRRYFSAAAASIDFLQRLSQPNRMHLHKLTILEDQRSVALPSCHAQGLIPFC